MNHLVIKIFILLLFLFNSCISAQEEVIIDSNFLCEFLNENDHIDQRVLGFPPSLKDYNKGVRGKKINRDSLSTLIVHLWDDTIDPNKFQFLENIPDSLNIKYLNTNRIVVNKKKILENTCNYYNVKNIDSLPKKGKVDRSFFDKPSASILVQLSDLYIDKNSNYGIIHLISTNGFKDNTKNNLIIMEKEGNVWRLKK